MLTGRQVYEACQLTGRSTAVVAKLSGVAYATLVACRNSDEPLPIDFMGTANIRRELSDLGVDFYVREDGRPSVRMRAGLSALGSWRKG